MTRQMYESPQDIENERDVIGECCMAWDCRAKKLACPPYKVDWMLSRESPDAFAEVKCRRQFYDPFLIGLHKFSELTQLAQCAGLRALIIVRWQERGTHWADVTNGEHDGIHWMQDKREREEADGEPCVAIAFERFRCL